MDSLMAEAPPPGTKDLFAAWTVETEAQKAR
jgi:hypothetical protein